MRCPRALVLALMAAIIILASGGEVRTRAAQQPAHRAPLAGELETLVARRGAERVRVLVRSARPAAVGVLARRLGLPIGRRVSQFTVVEANGDELAALRLDPSVAQITRDVPVRASVTLAGASTGADQAWAGKRGGLLGLGRIPGVTGRGIGVAVIDSGIARTHQALAGKVRAAVSFVPGDTAGGDAFGHGTHIAGIITGSGAAASGVTSEYAGGLAPGAHLVDVRVLGDDGIGYTSDVIAGIDWVIAHRRQYGIRIINLSLGHPVTESALADPLCDAVARAVSAGIVVVAAAGNYGVTPDGAPVLGGITSPGNSPYALTVGALDTADSAGRNDDSVAVYSSRGPTRFDLAAKPDLAAPGHRIVSLEAPGSSLAGAYPSLHTAGSGTNGYFRMSGSSMATAVVSAGAALLLEGSPRMSPSRVKVALQSGASYVGDAGVMGAGAGSVNLWSSRRITTGLLGSLPTSLIGGLVAAPSGLVFFDAGSLTSRAYAGSGLHVLNAVDALLRWLSPSLFGWGDLNIVGLGNPLAGLPVNELLWGEVATWTSGQNIVWGFQFSNPEGQNIVWGYNGPVEGSNIVWGFGADPAMLEQ